MGELVDVLVVGGGPAALAIAAACAAEALSVAVLSADDIRQPWANTYGIWGQEVDELGLAGLLEHRWSHTSSYFGPGSTAASAPHDGAAAQGEVAHGRDYGLFDKALLQQHWLGICDRAGVRWLRGRASAWTVEHHSSVSTAGGERLQARLVIDATGHQPALLRAPGAQPEGPVAGQAAYGVVGRFNAAPVQPGQFVLMDFRCDHLDPAERHQPPTFLYAMDLGEGRFFVEETSLALAPSLPFAQLQQRLHQRLAHRGIRIEQVEHEEFCLFPMNPPLPDRQQPLLGFGGAAAMVHPASGYMVGALLRRAPGVAQALALVLRADPEASSATLAAAGWQALWPRELQRRHALYRFGLEKLMRFTEAQLRAFFATFFALPEAAWFGFLTNTLSLPALIGAMVRLFITAPWGVRWGLMQMQGRELALLAQLIWPRA
jgi:lycopene cyclase-like protein